MPYFNSIAGHGKTDSGALYKGVMEKNETLRISLAFSAEMRRRGHTIKEFRTDDSINCGKISSGIFIDKNPANISLVWHLNAWKPEQASGTEIWSYNADIPCTDFSVKLSKVISDTLSIPNRGRKGNGTAWLTPSRPCISIEICFIDNTSDMQKYNAKFDRLIIAVCDFCEMYCGKAEISEIDKLKNDYQLLNNQKFLIEVENQNLKQKLEQIREIVR